MFFADKNGAFELILGSALIKMDALQPQNIKICCICVEKKLLEFSDNLEREKNKPKDTHYAYHVARCNHSFYSLLLEYVVLHGRLQPTQHDMTRKILCKRHMYICYMEYCEESDRKHRKILQMNW